MKDFKNKKEWKGSPDAKAIQIGKKFTYRSKFYPEETVYVQHGEPYIPKIFKVIRQVNPSIFIELGTFNGGLTLIIHEEFKDLEIHTFDHMEFMDKKKAKVIYGENVEFHLTDILGSLDDPSLVSILRSKERKILYCDNGNKVTEINKYAKYLSIGDVIGCHDWLVNVDPEDVKEALSNFELFDPETWCRSPFLSRFWIKK